MLPALTAALVGAVVAGGATLFNGSVASTADGARLSVDLTGDRVPGGLDRPSSDAPTTAPTTTTTTTTVAPPPPTTTTEPPPPPPPTTTEPPPPPPTAQDNSQQAQVVALVNQFRAEAGCGPVSTNAQLTDAAQKHASDMSARDYFSHDTPEGVTFDQRIRAAGYDKPGAENIAKGASTAAQVMDMWMNSPGHRRNILNCDLNALGVGLDRDGDYWVQDFGY